VNRQINYILYAFFLLFLFVLGYFIIQKFPWRISSKRPSVVISQNFPNDSLPQNLVPGKKLFQNKCVICHNFYKLDGYFLNGFENRWTNKKELFAFIRNPEEVIKRNSYAKELKERFKVVPLGFPELTDEEIQSILDYMIWATRPR
jgi:cytochrome c1